MKKITELKLSGFGGQGIILAASLLGKAASIYEDQFAVLIQSFGPEARGGACQAQLILSEEPVLYPYVLKPDILLALSQQAYTKYIPELVPNGTVITERDLVDAHDLPEGANCYSIPSTAMAEEMGRKIVQNIVTLGYFIKVTKLVQPESMIKAIKDTVPPGTIDLNLQAFDEGFNYTQN